MCERFTRWAMTVGLVLVLLMYFARMRYTWWPIHPVMFAVLSTYQSSTLSASFLLGWLIKTAVVRLGGNAGYHRFKPVMIGLIAGDVLAAVVVMAHGVENPKRVRFGWHKTANPNLMNKQKLPASPFQSENWQGGTGE